MQLLVSDIHAAGETPRFTGGRRSRSFECKRRVGSYFQTVDRNPPVCLKGVLFLKVKFRMILNPQLERNPPWLYLRLDKLNW